MQSQVFFYVDMQGKGKSPLPLHSIPKTNNNSKTKSNNKTKTKNKIKVVYTEDLTHPRPRLASNTAGSGRGPWYLARAKALSVGLSNAYFKSLGLPTLIDGC
jgi:hypothetical protein